MIKLWPPIAGWRHLTTLHGQGLRLCTDPKNTIRSSSSRPAHVETGQGLGMFSWSSVLGYSKWKGNERIGEIPENQGKCQDNELPMGKLMRFPFNHRNHRIGGDNYDNKLRIVAMRPMIKCWKARNVLNEIQKGAELSWHFFFAFFLFGVGFLVFSLFFQQFSSSFQLFSLVFQRFSSIFHSSLWFSSAFHQFSIVFKNCLAFPSVFR